jgi:hypothetical protein
MNYRYVPDFDDDRPWPEDNATALVLMSIELNFPNLPIPEWAFVGNATHRDRLIEMGWLEVVS